MVAVTAAEQAVAPALTPNAGGPASRQHSRALAESTAVGNGGAWSGARSRGQQGDGGRAEESLAVAVTRPAHVGIDLGDPAGVLTKPQTLACKLYLIVCMVYGAWWHGVRGGAERAARMEA